MSLSEQLTISIASKDRPEVVNATLHKIHAFGLGECPLIVCDDGSTPPLNPPTLSLFTHGRLIRNEAAQGQALARNRIARECATPYLLQLDDDSYPVEGDIRALLGLVQDAPNWLAIAIPFEEPARMRTFPVSIPSDHPIKVRSFVGCSALFHVERFLVLDGYADWVGGMVEEEELSLRALANGCSILTINLLRIRHEVTETSRNRRAIALCSLRNWLLMWMIHAPLCVLPWRVIRLLLAATVMTAKQRDLAALEGIFHAVKAIPVMWKSRKPVSMNCYFRFRALPHALDHFIKKEV
jgi:hypothetical protein